MYLICVILEIEILEVEYEIKQFLKLNFEKLNNLRTSMKAIRLLLET